MALVIADRVRETTTSTGTGTITLAGPYTGFQAFSVIGNGNTTYYALIDAATGAWEVGIGTYTATGNTLSRDTVLSSSNGGAAVNFSAGTKDVIITQPASRAVYLDTASNVTIPGITLSGGTANGVAYLNASKVLTTGSALTFDGTNFATTGSVTSAGASNSGNLAFTGTGNRITGDFSNATLNNRVVIQSSFTNGNTIVTAAPSGSNSVSALVVSNASDLTNASYGNIQANSATEVAVRSDRYGTGTYLPMTFYTGGSERVRIDTSGNVGIGTSSTTNAGAGYTFVSTAGSTSGAYQAFGASASDARVFADNGFGGMGMFSNHPFLFYTNSAERARIDSSGNLLVGTTTATGLGNFQYDGLSKIGMAFSDTSNSGTTQAIVFRKNTGTQVGSIQTSTTATSYVTSSDYRLKEAIQPMTGALAKVAALKPCTYKWKVDGSDGEGFIAHELAEVCPQAVTGEKDAVDADGNPVYQGIDTSFLVATLTAAIQEQQAIIEALKARLDAANL